MPPVQTSTPLPQALVETPVSENSSDKDVANELHTKEQSATGSLTVDEVLKLHDASRKYVETGFRVRWDNYYKIYKGKRVNRNYQGVSDPVIRESHTIIETLVANIAGGNPKFHYTPTNEEQAQDTEVLNEMLDYDLAYNQFTLKNQEGVREMCLYGTGVWGVNYEKGKPIISNKPIRDFFIDPTSTGLVKTLKPAEYCSEEYLQNIDTLKRQKIYDAEAQKWVPRYKNLDKIGTSPDGETSDGKNMDKKFKDLFNGSTIGEEALKTQVHVIKFHHLPTGRIYEIGNRKEFIYNEPTWCQREEITKDVMVMGPDGTEIPTQQVLDEIEPFLPYVAIRDYIDSSQFYAEGEMALIADDAELLNDYEAMQVDNNAYQNTPTGWIDPQFADLAPEIEMIPGALYPVPRNAMGWFAIPQLSGDLDNKQEKIMQRMRRATAADEQMQGGSTGNSRTTATEVSTQMAQAQMRISTRTSNLEMCYDELANILFKIHMIFTTKKTAKRIVGKNGVYFKDFDPFEYNGEWEPHAQLDSTIKQKQMEVGQKDNQIYELLADDPQQIFNPVEIKRWMLQKVDPTLSDEAFNKLLAPPKEPVEDSKDITTISYKDAPAMTRAEMERKAGLNVNPIHEAEAEIEMMELASRSVDILNPATDTNNNQLPGTEQILNPEPATPPAGMATA